MTELKFSATALLAHRRASKALVKRGRAFMRDREAFVRSRDCLPSMIMACIAEGARTRDDIVRNVPRYVGHGYAHVAGILDEHEGPARDGGYWYRDEAKVYRLHFPVKAIDPPVEMKIGRSWRQATRKKAQSAVEASHELY